jgi:hypothetical protein
MTKLIKVLLPTICGVAAYLIVNKFFPDNLSNQIKDGNPKNDMRGGDVDKRNLIQNSPGI